jgi:aryl-alcohol dehydrogenase-like predicted oxidoreductase
MSLGEVGGFPGTTMPDATALRVLDVAFDAGIDTIDTANIYSAGGSERLLGRWLTGKRDRVTVCTKCRFETREFAGGQPSGGLSRQSLIRSVEGSLRRLKSDYIDLLQLHMQDAAVPIEETLRAVDELVQAGKVRYVGCSNFTAYRLVEALWTADKHALSSLASIQIPWSLLTRDAENELVPAARTFGLGVLVYSPLARGLLSGKYVREGQVPRGSRLEEWPSAFREYDLGRAWDVIGIVLSIAKRYETTAAAISLSWLLTQAETTSVILGVRSERQLLENLTALRIELSPEDRALLDCASAPDQGYPYSLIRKYEQL